MEGRSLVLVMLAFSCHRDQPPQCVPGASVPCACADGTGRSSAQLCGANGTFGPCVCPADVQVLAAPTLPPIVPRASHDDPQAPRPSTPLPQGPETSSQRRAREPAEREASDAAAAAAYNDDGFSPMQLAQGCWSSTSDEPARNNCIINALRGHANSMQELGMLAAVQMTANRSVDAVRTMRTYIQRYPQGPLVLTFQRYIDSHP